MNTGETPKRRSGADANIAQWRIGAPMQAMSAELLNLGGQLQHIMDRSVAPLVGEALAAVKKQHCEIAVLGQIKAGKSTFVNALVRRPGLLPADVNPWTAVVTRLHFAKPGQPQRGALFTFFDQAEWQRLAEGGGALKELTDRLVPGYDEELRVHLQATQRRAELRLGNFYRHMLGHTRSYADATPEVIESYVCLGQHVETALSEPAPGRFADITKSADLFFDSAPFAYPATVIDTPGTNDPLLIRDEITLNAIQDADVFIIVLTAQQPLTDSDLALLRILHGLRKDRIAIFINRLDEVSGIVTSRRAILAGVRKLIEREFPASEIPVVAGSALWANAALGIENADLSRLWGPELIAYAHSIGAMQAGEPASLGALSRERAAEVLVACSGLPEMAALISKLMLKGTSGYWLKELCSMLGTAAENTTASARNELLGRSSLSAIGGDNASRSPNPKNIAGELERVKRLAAEADRLLNASRQTLLRRASESLGDLRGKLEREISAYSAKQAESVRASWLHGHGTRTWRFDALELRNLIEERVLSAFGDAGKELVEEQRNIGIELKRILRQAAPRLDLEWAPSSFLNFNLTPPLTALSKPLAFDLEDKWWQLWGRKTQAAEERAKKVEELIVSEFFPVAAELASSAQAALRDYVSFALKHFFIRSSAVTGVIRDLEQELARVGLDEGNGNAEQEGQEDAIVKKLKNGERLKAQFGACVERYNKFASGGEFQGDLA